ncbi:MAG: RecQ family ATP-dependent DNA helicase [Fimbriimonas sp.]
MADLDLYTPLKNFWGYDELRPLQQEAVLAALNGQDSVVVMPTGGGKSLCFQLPPLVDGGLTVVVSPLISLMKDQVDGLKLLGYPGDALNSNLKASEASSVLNRLASGDLKLLYLSPERLFSGGTIALLQNAGVRRIAIDEAHCISQWGHDFRPEYRQLSRIRHLFPSASIHALTATATPQVREDIQCQLALRNPAVLVGTFDRPNLTYRVVPKVDAIAQSIEAIRRHPEDASIIYCLSRKDTETMAGRLNANGIEAAVYHAGLSPIERQNTSEGFAQERINVVVATVAFGMGIDRSNVRVVIHESIPTSIEGYQQETGRAGRDGLPSECLLLYDAGDVMRRERLLRDSPDAILGHRLKLLNEVRHFALSTRCRHAFLSEYFGQEYLAGDSCEACDICLEGWQEVPESTRKAHMILAIVRSLDRQHGSFGFGAAHIAAILSGADTKSIRNYSHQDLKGYGAMRGTIATRISGWVNQLCDQGFLARTGDRFPALHLSEEGANALQNRQEIALRDMSATRRTSNTDKPEGFDDRLFEALRSYRRELATERSVPAYVLFHDAVLIQMASSRPTSLESLGRISGVGQRKLEELGPMFTELIRSESARLGLATDLAVSTKPVRSEVKADAPVSLKKASNKALMYPLFQAGVPLESICAQVTLAPSTVSGYLSDWIIETCPENIDAYVDRETYNMIAEVAKKLGTTPLRPIWDALGEQVDYNRIRLVTTHLIARSTAE